jgi:hypothetical protein
METGNWKMENGNWKLGTGKWKLETGEWKLESGNWKIETGKWKLARYPQRRRPLVPDAIFGFCGFAAQPPTPLPHLIRCWRGIQRIVISMDSLW